MGPGAQPGTVPTDLEQSTGVERLEILGKMEGVDIFDMKPLDASRKGTLKEPILVRSAGEEQYAGCTGYPVDSHGVIWLTVRPPQTTISTTSPTFTIAMLENAPGRRAQSGTNEC